MSRFAKVSFLETVFPPFTNRNVKTLTDKANQNISDLLKESNFYMIAARAETSFVNFEIVPNSAKIKVDIQVNDTVVDSGIIDISKLDYLNKIDDPIIITTEQAILIDTTKKGTHAKIWLTPDSIYWNLSRGADYLSGFQNYRTVCNYDLLYVGIAAKQDSYTRLLKKGHHVRQRILGEEDQRRAGAHVTDEIILFLYSIKPIFMKTFSEDNYDLGFGHGTDAQARIVADAEKAFIKLLDPQYNTQKFANYPKGEDGLFDQGMDSYSYSINEDFIFNTASSTFNGKRGEHQFDNHQDFIHIEGEAVKLYISGKDFLCDEFPSNYEKAASK